MQFCSNLSSLETIPKEIICYNLCEHLGLADLGAFSQVNKYFNKLSILFTGWRLPSDWQRLYGQSIFKDERLRKNVQYIELEDQSDFKWLRDLPNLHKLVVGLTEFYIDLYNVILQLKQLEELSILNLSSPQIIEILLSLPNLTSLRLGSCTGSLDMLNFTRCIKNNGKIQHLNYSNISREIFRDLQPAINLAQSLKSLCLSMVVLNEPITIESKTLELLDIDLGFDIKITLDIPSIKYLFIVNISKIDNVSIISDMPCLESFQGFGSMFLHPMIQPHYLHFKILKFERFTYDIFKQLDQFRGFISLRELWIVSSQIQDYVTIDCPSLTSLKVRHSTRKKITIKSCHLKHLSIDCPINIEHRDQLETMNLRISYKADNTRESYPMLRQVLFQKITDIEIIIPHLTTIDLTIEDSYIDYDNLIPLLNERCTQLESLTLKEEIIVHTSIHIKLPKLKKLKISVSECTFDTPSLKILLLSLHRFRDSHFDLTLNELRWLQIEDNSYHHLTFNGYFPKLHRFLCHKFLIDDDDYHNGKTKKGNVVIKVGSTLPFVSTNIDVTIKQ